MLIFGGGRGLTFGWAYIRVEKCVTNLGGLYSGELIHREGAYLRNFTVFIINKNFILVIEQLFG